MQRRNRLIRRVPLANMDTVRVRQKEVGKEKDIHLLERCNWLWDNLSGLRETGARVNRFAYGDQWGDIIVVNGKRMTMRDYLMKQGNVVMQTNQVKNKIDTIVGVLIKEQNEPIANARDRDEQQYGELVTAALQANCYKNKMEVLYALWMRDICIRGLCSSYETYDSISGPSRRKDSWTKYVNPNHLFFDSAMTDPRFWDMTIVGQFFDLSSDELAAFFAKSATDYAILKSIYPEQFNTYRRENADDPTDKNDEENLTFLSPADPTKCRVYEVWTLESKPRIRIFDTNNPELGETVIDADDDAYRAEIRRVNEQRRMVAREQGWTEEETSYIIGDGFGNDELERNGFFVDKYWYCRFLAADGTILWEGESPLPDRGHPFSFCATPFVDGKIVPYMYDSVDHNMAINRAVVLHDWLLRCQAKGVVVVPKAIVPKDIDPKDFARSWTSIDDMVFIEMKPGEEHLMPKVFYGTAQTFDVASLINTYKGLMEDSTSVTGAMQGKTPYSGTSGALYAQMASNASTPIASILSTFHNFLEDVHTKKMKNIVAFYDEARFAKIAGKMDGVFDNQNLDLNHVGDIEYDLAVKESTETPVHRFVVNDTLEKLLNMGAITPQQYLHYGYFPGTEGLYQEMQARQAEVEAAQRGEIPQAPPAPSGGQ